MAAELFNIDLKNQDPNAFNRDFWDLVLDPEARGRYIADELQKLNKNASTTNPPHLDSRLNASDFYTVYQAVSEHVEQHLQIP